MQHNMKKKANSWKYEKGLWIKKLGAKLNAAPSPFVH